jgi:hypothetical protein
MFTRPYFEKTHHKKGLVEWPQFKPQYIKKKKKGWREGEGGKVEGRMGRREEGREGKKGKKKTELKPSTGGCLSPPPRLTDPAVTQLLGILPLRLAQRSHARRGSSDRYRWKPSSAIHGLGMLKCLNWRVRNTSISD